MVCDQTFICLGVDDDQESRRLSASRQVDAPAFAGSMDSE